MSGEELVGVVVYCPPYLQSKSTIEKALKKLSIQISTEDLEPPEEARDGFDRHRLAVIVRHEEHQKIERELANLDGVLFYVNSHLLRHIDSSWRNNPPKLHTIVHLS